jgi:hypothetical protein
MRKLLVAALAVLALIGAGWKWSSATNTTRAEGWTWDSAVVDSSTVPDGWTWE